MSKWKTVRLGDVCILEKGQQIDTSLLDDSKTYRYINGGIKESGYFDKFNTSGESVLISEGGASCGYINYVNEDIWCGCHCYRLHDIKVFPKYLFHALKANQQRIMALRTGSAMPNIQKSTIQKFQLKIHDDLTTQKNISTMLDKCNELIEKYKKMLEKYDTLIKSRFIEMFGNYQNSECQTLETLCSIITDGTHQPPKFTTSGIPFLFVSNIAGNKLTYETEKFISEETYKELYKRTPIEIGDILLSTVGSYGHPAIVENNKKFLFQRHIAYLKPKKDFINSVYFHGALLSPDVQKQIEERVKGIAQKTLNLSEIRKITIPVPPIELQNDFADFVQQIDKSKFAVQKSLEKAETLYKSLMQEYFG